ncbi:hypothetical protein EJ074_11075 [Mesorhizobium sp. M3A.F.Ca.ET.080.04.2.1]|uniref:hypothetical protein n=1 Tax=unclassified Mesorhizobium TaxID=325217 RepID=UPI000F750CF0|nr:MULTISPECIES: hypothetical protein [unclassified Mesorhizobium]AZO09582.1 hypothetical protein EJ074_11075 [Mesorhizobium sp. M3A.F.Ca.ET.080.04.2.1]RWE33466.1 MAG: hypothetical protein EOS77_12110 [Mesorhizobium sp.]RWF25613.1 MAG: hypothetical protein EOS64_04025 [Mesorhizobium sp.]
MPIQSIHTYLVCRKLRLVKFVFPHQGHAAVGNQEKTANKPHSRAPAAVPISWKQISGASTADANAIAAPEQYRDALSAAGFEILSERQRRDVALDYFARQRAQAATGRTVLGVQTLMGARRPQMVPNMSESIAAGLIAPVEMIARRR